VSASTAGAIKAYIESLGLSLSAYRDGAPTDDAGRITAAYPHVVIQEGIAYGDNPQGDGDFGDHTQPTTEVELVQVDLYQHARALTGGIPGSQNVESYDLPGQLRAALRGAKLGLVGSQRVYGVTTRGGRRWPIADNVVRHTIDLEVNRTLDRS
jgi:hypothetical protein